jgi:hypothetical protein
VALCGFAARFKTESGLAKNIPAMDVITQFGRGERAPMT